MKHSSVFPSILTLALIAVVFTGCSRDPNVRKQKFLASGQRYFAEGKYPEAAIQFSNAIDLDPGFAEAHYQLAQTELKLRAWNLALQELNRTIELQPQNYAAHIGLAKMLISGREFKLAQEQVDLLLAKQPDDPQVHLVAADLLAAQQKIAGAIQETQKAISLAPQSSESYLSLALLQTQTRQPETAEASFNKAIQMNPNSAGAYLALGTYDASRSRFADAERQFRQALAVEPKNPQPREALANLYLEQKKNSEAEEVLKQAKGDLADNPDAYRMLGDFYFATGQLDKALDEYAALAHDHPADWQVKKNYTQLLILKSRLEEARQLDDEILKSFPNDSEGLIYRAQIQNRTGHPGDAVTTLQTVIRNDPDNALAHYHMGLAFQQLGSADRAQSEWQEAIRLRPDLSDARRSLANLALSRGDMPTLEQTASQMIKQQPNSADGYVIRALSFTRRGQFASAAQDVDKAISLAPQDPAGYIQMGNLKLAQKQYGDAQKAYQQALDHNPASGDALAGLMTTYLTQQQADKAVAAANAQIAKVPGNSNFYDLLGTALFFNKKDLDGAEAAFTKAIELDKNNASAALKLGQVQVAKGSIPDAIATYQRALKDNPREVTFYILIGELYDQQHDAANAKQSYQKALELDSNNALASNNLAYLLLQNGGDVDQALSLAQTARHGAPNSPGFADTLGWALYHKGYYQQSIDLFQQALQLAAKSNRPDNANFHYHLGLAYEKAGKPEQAKKELQRVLQINPNYSNAADVKKALTELHS